MPDYQFHMRLEGATRSTVTNERLSDDHEALGWAKRLLARQPRAIEIMVCQGERFVGARRRDHLPAQQPRATILLVEDCFLQADTARAALEDAGYAVRCCGGEDQALAELDRARPTLALVDINLGQGPAYAVAEALERRGVPLAFVTGYDRRALPARWRGAPHVCKPATGGQIVEAVRDLLGDRRPAPAGADRQGASLLCRTTTAGQADLK